MKKIQSEFSFILKISILFILVGIGVYSNHQNNDLTISELFFLKKENIKNHSDPDNSAFLVVFEK